MRRVAMSTLVAVVTGVLAFAVPTQAAPAAVDNATTIGVLAEQSDPFASSIDLATCNRNLDIRPAVMGTVSAQTGPTPGPQAEALVVAERIGDDQTGSTFLACAFSDAQGRFALDVSTSASYEIVVDAPTTSAYGGGHRSIVITQDGGYPATSPILDLGLIDLKPTQLSGWVKVDGQEVPAFGTPNMPGVAVCLEVPGHSPPTASCSVLRARAFDPQMRSRFTLGSATSSLVGATVSAYVGPGGGWGFGKRVLTVSDVQSLPNLGLEVVASLFEGGGTGPQLGNGCAQNQQPTLTGTVTAPGGAAYPTTISVLTSGEALSQGQDRYKGFSSTHLMDVTDQNGNYGFCVEPLGENESWITTYAVQAHPSDGQYGPTTGRWFVPPECATTTCIDNIVMRPRLTAGAITVADGQVSGGDQFALALSDTEDGGRYLDGTSVTYDGGQTLPFSLAQPSTSALPPGSYELVVRPDDWVMLLEDRFPFVIDGSNALVPGPRFGPGSTANNLVVTLSAANLTGVVLQYNGTPYAEFTAQQVDIIRDDSTACPPSQLNSLPSSCRAPSGWLQHSENSWKAAITPGDWLIVAEIYRQGLDPRSATGRFTVGQDGAVTSGVNTSVFASGQAPPMVSLFFDEDASQPNPPPPPNPPNPGSSNGCVGSQPPDLTGTVTLPGGAAYVTTVSVLASGDGLTSSNQRYRSEVSEIFSTVTDQNGQYRFCTVDIGYSQNTTWAQTFTVQAQPLSTDAAYGSTTGTWRWTFACSSQETCVENIEMRPRFLAGTVQLPEGQLVGNGDSLRLGLRAAGQNASHYDGVVLRDRTTQNRPFAFGTPPSGTLPNGDYELVVRADSGDESPTLLLGDTFPFEIAGGTVQPGVRFGPGSTPSSLVVTLSAANVTGEVVQQNGTPFQQNQLNEIAVIRDVQGCPVDEYYNLPASCFAVSDHWRRNDNQWKAALSDGDWVMRAGIDGLTGIGRFSVSGNGTEFTSSSSNLDVLTQQIGATPMLRLKVGSGNFRALPVRPTANNTSVSGLQANVGRWNGSWFSGVSANIRGDSGELVMNFTQSGIYQFTFEPQRNYGSGYSSMTPPADVASTSHIVEIEVAGSSATITKSCSFEYGAGPPTPQCTAIEWATVSAGASFGAYRFELDIANIEVAVCAPAIDGTPCPAVTDTWVELSQSNGQWFNYNRTLNPVDGAVRVRLTNTEQTPVVYQMKARPPRTAETPWSSPVVTFSVASDGTISRCPANDLDCTSPEVIAADINTGVVTLPALQFVAATMVANVLLPGDANAPAAPFAYVQVFRVDEGGFMDHLGGSEANGNGQIALDGIVTQQGTYRLEAQPPWGSSGYTSATRQFRVTESAGALAIHVEDAPLTINLGQPNVTGRVKAGGQNVPYANINVEQWNEDEQQWRWANRWANADNTGTYRITLPVGRWRLTSEPQQQYAGQFSAGRVEVEVTDASVLQTGKDITYQAPNLKIQVTNGSVGVRWANVWMQRYDAQLGYFTGGETGGNTDSNGFTALNLTASGVYRIEVMPQPNSGLTRATAYVSVSAGTPTLACKVNGIETANTCVGGYLDGQSNPMLIALSGPNLRGSISAGGVTVSGWVSVDRFSTQTGRYEWGELWADANSRDGFAIKLDPGTYRLMASPRSVGQYSRTTVFVTVSASASEWCRFASDPAANPSQTPTACSADTPRLVVQLVGANLVGGVTNGITNTSVSATWVNVERWNTDNNFWQWIDVHGDVQNGRFSMTLEPSSSPYRVTINPPFGNSGGVTRLRRAMWVMDDNSICVATAAQTGATRPADCSGGTLYASGATQHFVMTGGNVSGTVTYPGGATARDAEISVEIQEGNFWRWTENWTRTTGTGQFSLNLGSNGTYRITARPPWGAAGQYSPTTSTITVACSEGSCSTHSLAMELASPNVTITVRNPGGATTVPDAWINVERKVGDRWEWTSNGGNTSRQGTVAFTLDAGEYRLWVNQPWNRSDLARFSATISVTNPATPLAQTLTFPSPNFSVAVLDPSGQSVPNVWAYAQRRLADGRLEWADIFGGGNQSGVLTMSLSTDGEYRVVVEPPPGRTGLSRFSVDVTVSGGVLTPAVASIQFPTANVTGSARIGSPTGALARFGWVEIRQNNNFVEGTPVRESGTFSSSLADGVYELVVHPNYSQTQQPPIRLDVTVSGSNPLVWRYQGDPASETSGPLDVFFGRMQRNVKVTVSGTPVVGAGAFVTFRDTTTNAVFNFVTNAEGVAEGVVPVGSTYTISAVVVEGSAVRAGSITSQSVTVPPAPTVESPNEFTVTVDTVP